MITFFELMIRSVIFSAETTPQRCIRQLLLLTSEFAEHDLSTNIGIDKYTEMNVTRSVTGNFFVR